MQILSAEQIKALDAYTIQHEPILSIDLMERAATAVFNELVTRIKFTTPVYVFCGMGNNGGDGLAIARLLVHAGYRHVITFVVRHSAKASADFMLNEERYKQVASILYIQAENHLPKIPAGTVVVDALFGTGLSKPVTGIAASVIQAINAAGVVVYSVDVPSGLYSDIANGADDVVIQATEVFTFHAPKLSFMFAGNATRVPVFKVLDIELNKDYAYQLTTPYTYITAHTVKQYFKQRNKFSHKGTYGHVLVAAGSLGKIGAAVLSVRATLRSGAGLVSVALPRCGYEIMQSTCPEAMVLISGESTLTTLPTVDAYTSVAVGPGIGTGDDAVAFMAHLLSNYHQPMVIDADGLNILAQHPHLLQHIPTGSILTPHPGEFKRLVGEWTDDLHKLTLQKQFAETYKVIVVLKGAHTSVAVPGGAIYFNSTGNAGMAKGGSGDVLTGVLVALLAQRYEPVAAAVTGVYIHGLAGDYAAEELGKTGMNSGDIVRYLPKAFKTLETTV